MTPLILACDTPGLKESLALAYSRPPTYQDRPVASVPDHGMTITMLVVAFVVILLLKSLGKKL